MQSKTVIINSKDKISGTNTDFRIQFNDSVMQSVVKIQTLQVFIPNQFYNIDESNNYLEFKQGINLVNFNFQITPGQYNIDQLITVLETEINAQLASGASTTITKNEFTNQLILTTSGGAAPVNNQLQLIDTSTIKEVLGFIDTTSSLAILTLPFAWNLNQLQYVQVHSQDLASSNGLDGGSTATISLLTTCSLVETPYGGVATVRANDNELAEIIYDDVRVLNQIRIKLRDSSGRLLTLPDNHHVTVIVKVYY